MLPIKARTMQNLSFLVFTEENNSKSDFFEKQLSSKIGKVVQFFIEKLTRFKFLGAKSDTF